MLNRKLYFVLALIIALAVLFSCGKNGGDLPEETGGEIKQTEAADTEESGDEVTNPYAPASGMRFSDLPTYLTESAPTQMPLTFEAWVKCDIEGDGSSNVFGNLYKTKTNAFCFRIRGGVPTLMIAARSENVQFLKSEIEPEVWTHVAIAIDIESMKFHCYINGEHRESKSMVQGHVDAINAVEFDEETETHMTALGGRYSWETGVKDTFCGEIGSFAAYSDLRTAEEIAEDCKNYSAPDHDGLMLAYVFDKPGQAVYRDLSRSENDLTWMGFGYLTSDELEIPEEYDYSMIVVGDTQGLTGRNTTDGYYGLYDWIAENIEEKKVEAVIGVGDITNSNIAVHWEKAVVAFEKLKGKVKHYPILGNHDVSVSYGGDDPELYKDYIKLEDIENSGSMDGSFKCYYHTFEIEGNKYLILGMGYEPKQAEVDWAKTVLDAHPDHNVILSCHGYLDADGELLDHSGGPILRKQLVLPYNNIVLVLCGHMHNDNVLLYTEVRDDRTTVQALLTNPQEYNYRVNKGIATGLYFTNGGRTVHVANHVVGTDSCLGEDSVRSFELDLVHERTAE